MLLAIVLMAILVLWGLKDGEIYGKEAVTYGVIGAACFAAMWFGSAWPVMAYIAIGVITLLNVYLLYKLVGNPSAS